MNRLIDSITLRSIAHATEDLERVVSAMKFISGRSDFQIVETTGYHGNEIRIITLEIRKYREIVNFWKRLADLGVIEEILPILDDLVDEDGYFYLRFDKQEAFLRRVAITTGGDSIAMRMKLLSYPKRKEVAIRNFREFLATIQS